MENRSNNVSQKEGKAKVGKPPTRLQKQAPASLQLDKVAVYGETSKAIPFLSPLILSPQPLPETLEIRSGKSGSNEEEDNGAKRSKALPPGGGWQHPAVPVFTEPEALFTCFQSQCLLVDNVQ
ncbi:hypothetical protein F2P56_032465 [Juglans regia]|uniref:Uncharacterized protein n=2 Tax=Juglans regia TaxID=51240 RepID=A0A833TZD8_JUGRE|nr:uncharacterized protein LOC108990495 [Juglans regia]KAF5446868.1 hypothetical protein F2P56_032465 [Juglans regia]